MYETGTIPVSSGARQKICLAMPRQASERLSGIITAPRDELKVKKSPVGRGSTDGANIPVLGGNRIDCRSGRKAGKRVAYGK